MLTTYERRISCNRKGNLQQLRQLQAERQEQRQRELEEAQLLAQQSLINGLVYEPKHDGFVFSNAEINRSIDRGNRLQEAKNRMSTSESTPKPLPFAAIAARAA